MGNNVIIAQPAGTHYRGMSGEVFLNGALRPVVEIEGVPAYVVAADLEAFVAAIAAQAGGLHIHSDDTLTATGAKIGYPDLVKIAEERGADLPASDKPARLAQLERARNRVYSGLARAEEIEDADRRVRALVPSYRSELVRNIGDRLIVLDEAIAKLKA